MKIAFVPLDQNTIGELDISDDSPKCFKIVFSFPIIIRYLLQEYQNVIGEFEDIVANHK